MHNANQTLNKKQWDKKGMRRTENTKQNGKHKSNSPISRNSECKWTKQLNKNTEYVGLYTKTNKQTRFEYMLSTGDSFKDKKIESQKMEKYHANVGHKTAEITI